jgi:signal transduction histidine kinase
VRRITSVWTTVGSPRVEAAPAYIDRAGIDSPGRAAERTGDGPPNVWAWHRGLRPIRLVRRIHAREHIRTRGGATGRADLLLALAGLLLFAAALLQFDHTFVMFAITGFFHAFHLRPVSLGVAGVFATSLIINTTTMAPFTSDAQAIGTYLGIVVIQTGAISAGLVFGAKGAEMDRKRQAMLVRLEEALEENAGLHAQLLTQAREAGVLDERQRMAREIHDTLAQGLTGIVTQVQASQRVWADPDQARAHLDRALALAKDGLAEARRSVQALRPRDLAEAHLPDALQALVLRWSEEHDVHAGIEVTGERVALSPAIEVALYRMAQEALTNVAKHAQASRVGVTLSYLDDVVLLDVRDDGRGMNGARRGGFGINSMTQRIRGTGGVVEIESTPGEGTAVSASVPAIPAAAPPESPVETSAETPAGTVSAP